MFQELSTKDKVAFIVFIIGLVIAVIGGLIGGLVIPQQSTVVIITLVLLGLVLGLLSLHFKKHVYFLIAVIFLVVVGGIFGPLGGLGGNLNSILAFLATFMASAGIVLAIKDIIDFGFRRTKDND